MNAGLLELTVTQRRPRRQNVPLPRRFRDLVSTSLPLVPHEDPLDDSAPSVSTTSNPYVTSSQTSRPESLTFTPRNTFGLARTQISCDVPDPEANLTLQDLSDVHASQEASLPLAVKSESFYPYPNQNSFLLGDWFWNQSGRISQDSFRKLVAIVGHPSFRPEDVRSTSWSRIDKVLGTGTHDPVLQQNGSYPQWLDTDAGWRRSPIEVEVPFHRLSEARQPVQHIVADLHHRPLVSIIRAKLTNPHPHFHYEPFHLRWKPSPANPSREYPVFGELYTSQAFLDAHRLLQQSPLVPNCTLPRFVVALMFWSDATHLTSVGATKLWPSYLYFGNESKYQRGKPSSHLCEHVAYFQAV